MSSEEYWSDPMAQGPKIWQTVVLDFATSLLFLFPVNSEAFKLNSNLIFKKNFMSPFRIIGQPYLLITRSTCAEPSQSDPNCVSSEMHGLYWS